ncbi:E3 ubiquitin-protein ligase PRT6-like [Triticum dicoccoides]|uniref:E3 ubiquitin-protein ligase PRT6-like n=1 Tax=Triticum dicoccoides TaxID=85692 RepID=UPI000E7B48E2|nr:E3 ubiquitin-protein ligase PRT6-like [Triticum dicoccoides]
MAGIDDGGAAAAAAAQLVQKLIICGVPEEQQHQEGLLMYLEERKDKVSEITAAILSAGTDLMESSKKDEDSSSSSNAYSESLLWLQWMMFRRNPDAMLHDMELSSEDNRAVCGTVWGQNGVAYRCRTCESDPTCVICVPCFQNGNHKDHDYSILETGGGCCDCGDATAWKPEGFCSRHKGAEQIKPLTEELASSVGPVLDELLLFWKERICVPRAKADDYCKRVAQELTVSVADMLLRFCACSESLLSFVCQRIHESPGLLDALMRAERILDKKVVIKLHELLLKLIAEPAFKYEFAKVFIQYYPVAFSEVIKGGNDYVLEEYPLIPAFSVQIFTVPALTTRLVREHNLLGTLLECLTALFLSCVGEDGRLQTSKWVNLYDASFRLLEDARYVLRHEEVSMYVASERPDLTSSWVKLLLLVQGMDPQKRVTSIHVEDENENLSAPFVLGHYLGVIQSLLMTGVFSSLGQQESTSVTICSTTIKGIESVENRRLAKVGRVSQENSVFNLSTRESSLNRELLAPAACLIRQCLKAIGSWLEQIGEVSVKVNEGSQLDNVSDYYEVIGPPIQESDNMLLIGQGGMPQVGNITGKGKMQETSSAPDVQLHTENAIAATLTGGNLLYAHPDSGTDEQQGILSKTGWHHVVSDVSSQETSFHIPLHRMLSLLLREAMKKCSGEDAKTEECSVVRSNEFFSQVLGGCEPHGFASVVMEHPLRVRVFCAQVRAGMWRKNGDAPTLSAEWYRSVQWFEQGLESDLFLLQCCGALSSPEFFVRTIQERFGLSDYTSLDLTQQNEYEPVLIQEMLTLIVQLVKEHRFCGCSTADNLKRELIYKLAVGDATHSQIVRSLPRDLSSSEQLQDVLDSVAVYSDPSGKKKGKYVLREAFWKELDLYHPRWSSRELQVAKERYCRFCKVSTLGAQLPQWTNVLSPLRSISKIATSKAVLQIVRAVLFYAVYTDASSVSRAPNNVLVTGLHLLSLALDICESESQISADQYGMDIVQHDDESWVVLSSDEKEAFPILTYSTELVSPETDKLKKDSMLTLLVSLMHKEKNDSTFSGCNIPSLVETLLKRFAKLSKQCMSAVRQLAPQVLPSIPDHASAKQNLGSPDSTGKHQCEAAIMAKMGAEQSKPAESMKSSGNEWHDVPTFEPDAPKSTAVETRPVCSLCQDSDSKSPLCCLIRLQSAMETMMAETVEDGQTPRSVAEFASKVLSHVSSTSSLKLPAVQVLEDKLEAERRGASALREEIGALKKQAERVDAVIAKTQQEMKEVRKKQAETDQILQLLLRRSQGNPTS